MCPPNTIASHCADFEAQTHGAGRVTFRVSGLETDIKTLADGDDYACPGISSNANMVETLVKRLIQHYAIG